ncbi:MAG: exodeoxyribonuclease V subunit gamma, partial [Pseudomonadota bacterium]
LEILADALADTLNTPLPSPFDKEIIVVQSKGMERWVSLELAKRHGIAANIRFPFPNAFIEEVFEKAFSSIPLAPLFDPQTLQWRIFDLLPLLASQSGFEPVRSYLTGLQTPLKLIQLSERIADTFDQYLIFRPEMILGWEHGKDDHWQAGLWRILTKDQKGRHRAALAKMLRERINSLGSIQGIPERVSVFGVSFLPLFHLEILAAISEFSEVNLFIMNPCKEYWGDIPSRREIKRIRKRSTAQAQSDQDLHLEQGNPILASMGMTGRDFFDLILAFECEEAPQFEEPPCNSLLSYIQSDILNLNDRPHTQSDLKTLIAEHDRSIQIHSCHSPMREMEVLYDQILSMFEDDPQLLPKDILVMAPDIEIYAPCIQAVFDAQGDDDLKKIPYNIADRGMRRRSNVIDSFLAILELDGSRLYASETLACLEREPIRKKYGLSESDIESIYKWVKATKICWGADENARAECGLPPFRENTWRAGLDRLLLGYAMPGQNERMFCGILPYDDIEGYDAILLGKFVSFAESLFEQSASMSLPRSLSEWGKKLTGLVETFLLSEDDSELQIQAIKESIQKLESIEKKTGLDKPVDFTVILHFLKKRLARDMTGAGFMTGGVTFCAMLPMRSIPSKVICLLGMNNNAYPRQQTRLGFDLIARHPRRGDRSRRNDDRYLFLETIMSARDIFYISYIGQDIRDNSQVPPSVLVNELIDYIEQCFCFGEGEHQDAMYITVNHRLHGFSPAYFKKDKKLFSYSNKYCELAKGMVKMDRAMPFAFINKNLPEPGEEWKNIRLEDLSIFLANPARFLLAKRLGIFLNKDEPPIEDREPFTLGGLEQYLLAEELVKKILAGGDADSLFSMAQAAGRLPHGNVGSVIYEKLTQDTKVFVENTRPFIDDTQLKPLEIDLEISGFRLTGKISGIYFRNLVRHRYARIKAKDYLNAWLNHLVINILKPEGYPRTSIIIGLEEHNKKLKWTALNYSLTEDATDILKDLLSLYWKGLSAPLHFFPESSFKYVDIVNKKKTPGYAVESVRSSTWNNDYGIAEADDPYYDLCFRHIDPLDEEFEKTAKLIFKPIIKHRGSIVTSMYQNP